METKARKRTVWLALLFLFFPGQIFESIQALVDGMRNLVSRALQEYVFDGDRCQIR